MHESWLGVDEAFVECCDRAKWGFAMFVRFRAWLAGHRNVVYAIVSVLVGVSISIFFNMSGRGLASATTTGKPIEVALVWLIAVFLIELVLPGRLRSLPARILRGLLCSGAVAAVVVSVALFVTLMSPDSARIYLMFRRTHIEAHWQVDPDTKVTFFPLSFYDVDPSGRTVAPRDFFVWDDDGRLLVNRLTHQTGSLWCPGATYRADLLDDRIYILKLYVEPGIVPCFALPASISAPRR